MLQVEAHPPVGYKLAEASIVELTPDYLKEFRGIKTSPTERPVTERRVKHLAEKLKAGLAIPFQWVLARLPDGTVIRCNGNHSSTMLTRYLNDKGELPSDLKVVRQIYDVENMDAVALLHQQWDDRASARSPGDISAIYQGLQPDLADVDVKVGKAALDGYAWYLRGVQGLPTASGDKVYTLFARTELHPWIIWLGDLHSAPGKTKELQSKPVIAACFATYDANEAEARAFWQDVARQGADPENATLPSTALDAFLYDYSKNNLDVALAPANVYQACIFCWNQHREGRAVPTVKYEIRKNLLNVRE